MPTRPHIKPLIYLLIGTLLLSTLACSLSGSNQSTEADQRELELAATQLAIELTQQALDESPAQPTETTVPAAAPDVSYEGISFSYSAAVADGANMETVPEVIADENMPFWETHPTYYRFLLNNYIIGEHFHEPEIFVYPLPEYIAIAPDVETYSSKLQAILASQSIDPTDSIPVLPLFNAGPLLQVQIERLDFQNGSGVRFLTMFGQAVGPVTNAEIFYTFQGITADGRYYVSGIMPIANPILPDNSNNYSDADWQNLMDNFAEYKADIEMQLNAQPAESFTPTLIDLDAIFASLQIDQ